ncbi:MAG TPA: HEAT repeat domain-containing protein [Methanocellaceae archaeon]|jgi:HEAT repeat protein
MGLFGSKAPDVEKLEQDKDVEGLINALKFNDAVIRMNAMGALARMRDARAIEAIVPYLRESFFQMYAVMALANIGDPAVPALVRSLGDKSPMMRAGAARALRDVSDGRAIEPLIKLLRENNKNVKIEAMYALGRAKDSRAIGPLLKVLADDAAVNEAASDALVLIGEPAVWPLINAIKTVSMPVRSDIYRTLVKIGKPAVQPLIKSLGDGNPAIRSGAAIVLGRLGEACAVEPLLEMLRQEKMEKFLQSDTASYRMRMIEGALAAIGEPAIMPLQKALEDKNGIVRWVASETLWEIMK